jgi:hypothetical protein
MREQTLRHAILWCRPVAWIIYTAEAAAAVWRCLSLLVLARLANLLKYSSVIISARHQNWLLYYLLILLGMLPALLDNRKHAERDDVLGHKKRHSNSIASSVKPEFPETRRGSSSLCADSMSVCIVRAPAACPGDKFSDASNLTSTFFLVF